MPFGHRKTGDGDPRTFRSSPSVFRSSDTTHFCFARARILRNARKTARGAACFRLGLAVVRGAAFALTRNTAQNGVRREPFLASSCGARRTHCAPERPGCNSAKSGDGAGTAWGASLRRHRARNVPERTRREPNRCAIPKHKVAKTALCRRLNGSRWGSGTRNAPEAETRIERTDRSEPPLQNIFPASRKNPPYSAGVVAVRKRPLNSFPSLLP